jgi:hypothetical protein
MPAERSGTFGYWRDPVFLISLAIYVVNRTLIKPHLHHYSPLFHGHLDDTLTVPVALPIYLFVYRWIGFRPDDEPPRWWEIGLHVAVWMVFFEWFGPVVLHRGVADPIDDCCIACGGLVAWALWQRGRLMRAHPSKHIF